MKKLIEEENAIRAYTRLNKGMNETFYHFEGKRLCGTDFHFEVGRTYEKGKDADELLIRLSGHTDPLKALSCHALADEICFAEVEMSGEVDYLGRNSLVGASRIRIVRELTVSDLIKAEAEILRENTGSATPHPVIAECADNPKLASSEREMSMLASGQDSQIATSGDDTWICSCGHGSQIASSGDSVSAESLGEDSVVMCAGVEGTAKAAKGSWITLAEWGFDGKRKPVCVKTEYVDGTRIKANTWYTLKNGEFVEDTETL